MVQAAVLDGLLFGASSFCQDGFATIKGYGSRCQVANALVVAAGVTVVDEGCDGGFQFTFEGVIFPKDAVFRV